ncbi:MAG: SDR family NAD(P)-dependent oxidoreductase [Rhizonema sp. PD37]|nr:SDR family NAD(P)-dependent oxidoreductase [Rhizonema sp. PD37]
MPQKTWLVTGASRGFGAEIAKAVLAAGDRLIATARRSHQTSPSHSGNCQYR